MNRKQTIIQLRNNRYTYKKIGDILGISKQRVYQICNPSIKKAKEYQDVPTGWKPINKTYKRKDIWIKGFGARDTYAEFVRSRDNHTCQICNKVWKAGERRFDVHHLDEENESVLTCENYKKFNRMITLCHKCHLGLPHIRKKMKKTFTNKK